MSEQHTTPLSGLAALLSLLLHLSSGLTGLSWIPSTGQDVIAQTSGEASNPGPNDQLAVFGRGSLRDAGLSGSYGAAIAREVAREIVRDPARAVHNAKEAGRALGEVVRDYFNGPAGQTTASTSTRTHRTTAAATPAPVEQRPTAARAQSSSKVNRRTLLSPALKQAQVAVHNRAKKNQMSNARAESSLRMGAVPIRTNSVRVSLPKRETVRVDRRTFSVEAYVPIQNVSGVQPFTPWNSFDDPNRGLSRGRGIVFQPGDGSLGPVIQAAVASDTHWRPVEVTARWTNTVANTSAGTVMFSMDPGVNVLAPTSRRNYVESCLCVDSNLATPWETKIPLGEFGTPGKWLRVRRTEYCDGDRSDYDFATANLATENHNEPVGTQLGRLELHIVIETKCETRLLRIAGLFEAVTTFALQRSSFTSLAENLTVSMTPVADDRAGVRILGSDFILDPGLYRIRYELVAVIPSGLLVNHCVHWTGTALSANVYDSSSDGPGDGFDGSSSVLQKYRGTFMALATDTLNTLTCNFYASSNPGVSFPAAQTAGGQTLRVNRVFFTRVGR